MFLVSSTIAFVYSEFIQYQLEICDSFCMSRSFAGIPLLALWLCHFFFSLLMPYEWNHVAINEIFCKGAIIIFIAYDLVRRRNSIGIANTFQFSVTICSIILMAFFAVWSIMRIQVLVFIDQDIFLRIAMEEEKDSLSKNFLWFLV